MNINQVSSTTQTKITSEKEASRAIADLIKQAKALLKDAEGIADEWGVSFTYETPAGYGTGATYTPKPNHENGEDWVDSSCSGSDDEERHGWQSSSSQC